MVFDVLRLIVRSISVNQVLQSDTANQGGKLSRADTFAQKVNLLVRDFAFLEVPFRFLHIEVLFAGIDLDVHGCSPVRFIDCFQLLILYHVCTRDRH